MALLIKRKPEPVKMGKLLKRKPNLKEKFEKGQTDLKSKLSLNKEAEDMEFADKVLASYIRPIIEEFYINSPIESSSKVPFYSKAGFRKGVAMIRKALRGTLFANTEFDHLNRKFYFEEILDSVMTHKLAMTPDYKPADKKFLRVSLDLFFFNPYSRNIGKSFFLYWMNNDPLPLMKMMSDSNPEITAEVIHLFEWNNLKYEDTNNIINGVTVFKEVLSTMTISPVFSRLMTPKKQAEILWVILTDVFESVGKSVWPKNMASPKFRTWIEKGLKESDYTL